MKHLSSRIIGLLIILSLAANCVSGFGFRVSLFNLTRNSELETRNALFDVVALALPEAAAGQSRPYSKAASIESLQLFTAPIGETIKEEFNQIVAGVYPEEIIRQLKSEEYNPVIIGYDHESLLSFSFTLISVKVARESLGKVSCKVAVEILPDVLGWIKEFLLDEREFAEKGTIRSEKPSDVMVQELRDFRERISKNYSQRVALQLLQEGIDVVPLEHPDTLKWIDEDRSKIQESEIETFWGTRVSGRRQAFTAIRRDQHGLRVLQRERPDIVAAGTYHAMKYELLLDRDGKSTFYVPRPYIDWTRVKFLWSDVHDEYRRFLKAEGKRAA